MFPHDGLRGQLCAGAKATSILPAAQGGPCAGHIKSASGAQLPALSPCTLNTKPTIPVPSACVSPSASPPHPNPARGHSRDWQAPGPQRCQSLHARPELPSWRSASATAGRAREALSTCVPSDRKGCCWIACVTRKSHVTSGHKKRHLLQASGREGAVTPGGAGQSPCPERR